MAGYGFSGYTGSPVELRFGLGLAAHRCVCIHTYLAPSSEGVGAGSAGGFIFPPSGHVCPETLRNTWPNPCWT